MNKKLENPDMTNNSNHTGTEISKTNSETMSSLEIAELTGKKHKDVLEAIRKMEISWEKVCGRKFPLTSKKVEMPNGGFREKPVYQLSKTECLYIATKFNDEARAKLVLRWEQLEKQSKEQDLQPFSYSELNELALRHNSQLIQTVQLLHKASQIITQQQEEIDILKQNVEDVQSYISGIRGYIDPLVDSHNYKNMTTREKIEFLIKRLCISQNVNSARLWLKIIDNLFTRSHIWIGSKNAKLKEKTWLDVAARKEVLHKLLEMTTITLNEEYELLKRKNLV